ncbi:MAG: tripartite tricarboxylate transporter TctB family protein [Desulfobacteraceae bacterium]|nr:MAG: tripartite tricarboxylate transporter TctB family protein [Desulfobacteraceae bacterium]
MRIRQPKNLLTGILFISFGAAAMFLSAELTIGTAAKMGPGFFPFALGALLVILGAVVMLRGLVGAVGSHGWPTVQLKPLAAVLLSVVLFSQVLLPLGLLLSTALLVILASTASHEFRWKEALLNAAVLVAVILAVFVYLLEFQIPVLPAFIGGRS